MAKRNRQKATEETLRKARDRGITVQWEANGETKNVGEHHLLLRIHAVDEALAYLQGYASTDIGLKMYFDQPRPVLAQAYGLAPGCGVVGLNPRDHEKSWRRIREGIQTAKCNAAAEPEPEPAPAPAPEPEPGPSSSSSFEDLVYRIVDERISAHGGVGDNGGLVILDKLTQIDIQIDGIVPEEFEFVLLNLRLGHHVILVGPTGCGKTHIVGLLAKALAVDYHPASFSEALDESGYMGSDRIVTEAGAMKMSWFNGPFLRAFRDGGVFLGDEVDKAFPGALCPLNMALSNGFMRNPDPDCDPEDRIINQSDKFYAVLTANNLGGATATYTASNPVTGDAIDRGVVVPMSYDSRVEKYLAGKDYGKTILPWFAKVRKVINDSGLKYTLSSRKIVVARNLLANDIPWERVQDTLLATWSMDDKRLVS